MTAVTEAVILMAGSGSRLRSARNTSPKPLILVNGRPLICYTFDALVQAGVRRIIAVTGFESEQLQSTIAELEPARVELHFAHNPEWQKQNGISVLAAAPHVTGPFLLTMSDHIFDPANIDLLLAGADLSLLNLAIDRKVDSIFDLGDAMKVQTRGDRIMKIGKNLSTYDAIDTGLFVSPPDVFEYLNAAKRNGDCSLADGVQAMARKDKARVVDIGNNWWQDVDTPEMLECAEKYLRQQSGTSVVSAGRFDSSNSGQQ